MVLADVVRLRLAVLNDTLADLRGYRDRFERDQLSADRDAQHMVLHAMYVAAQAAIDLALHAVADAGQPTPPTYQDAFKEAARMGLIDVELSRRLAGWAGLRNVVAHHYPIINYGKIYDALSRDLGDLEAFSAAASGWLARDAGPASR